MDHGVSVNGTEESTSRVEFFGFLLRTSINFLSHMIICGLEQLRIYSACIVIFEYSFKLHSPKETCNFERIFKYSRTSVCDRLSHLSSATSLPKYTKSFQVKSINTPIVSDLLS